MVFKQYREVALPSGTYTDIDMEVEVETTREGETKYKVIIWNLTASSWSQIGTSGGVSIRAGWKDGPQATLLRGNITSTKKELDGGDVKFTITGTDSSASALNQNISKTWKNKDPATIVADVGALVGLTPEVEPVGSPISGYWSMTKEQPASRWLDELVTIAQDKTGVEWRWFAERGRLYFQIKNQVADESPLLSEELNLLNFGKSSTAEARDRENAERYEFTSMLVPNINKGDIVNVQATQNTGNYKVESYVHTTSSDSGDHLTSGKLLVPSTEYELRPEYDIDIGS